MPHRLINTAAGTTLLVALCLACTAPVCAKSRELLTVTVADPYIELHTGPGRGYPIFHVVERGGAVQVLMRRTDWFKVRSDDRREGWVSRAQFLRTLQANGEPVTLHDGSREEYTSHRWELGLLTGDLSGARIISTYGGFSFNENLSAELDFSQALGRFSTSYMGTFGLTHVFAPEWRVSPYFTLGGGVIHIQPKATLVQTVDRTDKLAYSGIGMRAYVARRFMFKLEYKSIIAFPRQDYNEAINAWQAGFALFF